MLKVLNKLPKIVGHIYTLILVLISWVIFSFEDLKQIGTYLCTMFGLNGASLVNAEAIYYLKNYIVIIVIGIICSIPILQWWKNRNKNKSVTQKKEAIVSVITSLGYIAIVIISTASLVNNSFNPFLYFRF